MAEDDDDLAEAITELAETIRALRREISGRPGADSALERERAGPPIRPPTPSDVLRLADDVAIPALLAILEANVRALEAFQRGLRLVRREREVREETAAAADRTRDRADELRETTLEQLDGALRELQRAVSDGSLPRDRQARELIEEARRLRDDVDRRLREATEPIDDRDRDRGTDVHRIEIDDASDSGPDADPDDDEAGVDVDAELDTLRDRYGPDEPDDEGADGGTDEAGDDGGGDTNAGDE